MEIYIASQQKRCHIILSELTSAGYKCGTPIPFNMGEIGPNTLMSIYGKNDEIADMDRVYMEFERMLVEPWFVKQEMSLRVIGNEGSWGTAT